MEVIVAELGEGKFSEEIKVGKHRLLADEPKESGGNDLGPSPYDYILAALSTCTNMTVRSYADFKKIPLMGIIVTLKHEKVYAEDCKNCENGQGKIDHIYRQIELQGDLDEAMKKRLLDIANKCPVHRTLTSTVSITTALVK